MHCCKQHLTTRFFDFIADSRVDIVAFEAKTFAKKAEISCIALAAFKNLINYFENSQNKNLAELSNEQKYLID